MAVDLVIRNGTVVRDDRVEAADIAIDDQKFVEIGPGLTVQSKETIDAAGLHVFPGLIDSHVHFNEPGRTDWEGIATGSAALAAGGGTCFFDMPLNSSPPVLDGPSFDLKRDAALQSSITDFGLWGGLTPKNLDRMEELADRGVVGFKAFMCPSGIDDFRFADPDTLEAGMRIAARLGLLVAVHAEDPALLDQSRHGVQGHSWRDFLASRPPECELEAMTTACRLAKTTNCRLHIVHVSQPQGIVRIEVHRLDGSDVSSETCPHYWLLCEDDLTSLGALAKCAPPLRPKEDAEAMGASLAAFFDFVASDHSPAPASIKTGDDAFAIWGGIAGVQSTLSALFSIDNPPSHERIAALIAGNVARRFKIPNKGRIEPGFDADLCLVDVGRRYTLTRDMLLDRHRQSPYVGRKFRGLAVRTIVRGTTVSLDGRVVSAPVGRLVTPEHA